MNNVTLAINHNVPVVAILDLQDVTRDGIRCHTLDEVEASFLERDRIDAAVLVQEVAEKVVDLRSAHFVSRSGVRDDINNTATWRRCCDAIWEKVEHQTDLREDVFEHGDDLQR